MPMFVDDDDDLGAEEEAMAAEFAAAAKDPEKARQLLCDIGIMEARSMTDEQALEVLASLAADMAVPDAGESKPKKRASKNGPKVGRKKAGRRR
mmetsp:Transcript_19800/g.45481  ORF Transcript_19800/g.45481 Transcript_19800/m.45481 type:complete len:94 (-) Transcript_19800:126-407(-)